MLTAWVMPGHLTLARVEVDRVEPILLHLSGCRSSGLTLTLECLKGLIRSIVWVQNDQLGVICDSKASGELLHIIIKLFKDVTSSLLRDLENQTLWLLHVESCDVHLCLHRANLYNIEAFAHSLSLFKEDDAVFIENASLAVDDRSRLSQFLCSGSRAHGHTKGWLTHHRWFIAALVASIVWRGSTCRDASLGRLTRRALLREEEATSDNILTHFARWTAYVSTFIPDRRRSDSFIKGLSTPS